MLTELAKWGNEENEEEEEIEENEEEKVIEENEENEQLRIKGWQSEQNEKNEQLRIKCWQNKQNEEIEENKHISTRPKAVGFGPEDWS